MKYETICTLEKITEKTELSLFCIAAAPVVVLCLPVIAYKHIRDKRQKKMEEERKEDWSGRVEDIKKLSYTTKNYLVETGKIKISELPHDRKKYHSSMWETVFPFRRKRKLELGFQEIAYVENNYCERMHRFFEEQAEWVKDFEHWHGFRIVFVNNDELKEGMLFPQDFDDYMNHGFLWNGHTSSGDPEYGFDCQNYLYADFQLTSDEDIKRQMHLFMSKAYESFQWALV